MTTVTFGHFFMGKGVIVACGHKNIFLFKGLAGLKYSRSFYTCICILRNLLFSRYLMSSFFLHYVPILNRSMTSTTVPGKGKLTVSFESRIETRSSILDPLEDRASMIELGFESFESSMETRKNRESNELVA